MATWHAFRDRHLHDYTPKATALWLAVVACGLLALVWALSRLLLADAAALLATAIAVALSALASRFALQLPRATSAHSAADIFIFGALLHAGPAAAVLAAGIEGWVGTRRTSKRLSSWLASPAAGMTSMALCAWVFEVTRRALAGAGLDDGAATFCALLVAAPLPYLGTVLPLTALMALKRAAPLRPWRWLVDTAWMAAVYLGSAVVAGIVHLESLHHGPVVLLASAVAVLGLVGLLRVSFARQEAERRRQEARVDEAEREAQLSQQRFMAAFTHAAIGMAVVRPDDEILQVNAALSALLGVDGDALLRRRFCDLLHPGDAALFRRRVHEVLTPTGQPFSMELRVNHVGGDELWASVHCGRYDDPAGQEQCLIYQVHDITSRHLAERQLQHIAHHDVLTDLANRHCFQERLALAVERTRLNADERFAVMFMDLDRFKMVNDSFGHHAGNELLCTTAQRLRAGVRPGDLVARLGGDEFAVLLEHLHDAEAGTRLAQRLREAIAQPVSINGTEVLPAASVGITFSDLGYRTVEEILRDADLAMYEAKAGGRGRVAVFDQSMHEKVAERLSLESDLRRAIGEGRLSLNFQPIFELHPHRLAGFEALARWVHPERGSVSPAVFIALAEESGHIEALTDWVIGAAVSQLALWQKHNPQLTMNVNISGRDLTRPSLVEHVRTALAAHGVSPGTLTLEITETTLMGRIDVALEAMRSLRADGIRFSIDDFGTGYSSLAYLSRLPIDSLKIDRSFVVALHDGPQSLEIVRAILLLGRSLGRRVVAEGIETAEQLVTLRELGIDMGQGYLLSRPVRAEQATALLSMEQPTPA
jgi:diguanylate cyclase (GGDEF)-like protein/PAS domain S-box-containing protein